MLLQPISRGEAVIDISVQPDDIPIRGNAIVSGDDAFDRQIEDELLARCEQGDVWAWALVTVTANWGPFSASSYLGGCSYESEEDFRKSGDYFDDMVGESLAELNQSIHSTYEELTTRKGTET